MNGTGEDQSTEEWRVSIPLRNRVFFAIDVVGWSLVPTIALGLRLDGFHGIYAYGPHLLAFTMIAVVSKAILLWKFGMYSRYWRYASIEDLVLVVASVGAASLAAAFVYLVAVSPLWEAGQRLPRSVPILDGLLTLVFVGGNRFAVRASEHFGQKWRFRSERERVLIAGAGTTGVLIVRELRANPRLAMEPVAFVDENPEKHSKTICGLPCVGNIDRISVVARESGISAVIIAMPSAPGRVLRAIRDQCERAHLQAKTVPGLFEILTGRVGVTQLRDVQIEDLLRREPVRADQRAVVEFLKDSTVLITGAGGSIGSEICRQVAELGARELILVGKGENSVFEIHNELVQKYGSVQVVPIVADICNAPRMRRVFETYRPRTVFHAAAHKHVPLMELNPEEAVITNVGGTQTVVEASEAIDVEHFVFVSTDKAVNPANVMGATKLLAERLVHDAAARTGGCYVSVRFGNVLASRGSVVPMFQRQIARGGPVTVTHRDMTRYFMTIPEAVQLVLQAAVIGRGGETFVLDMGQPVRILDLAKDLINLSGFEVDRDIEIVFTGLRPGEKMVEELYTEADNVQPTKHDKVFVVRNGTHAPIGMQRLRQVVEAAVHGDPLRLRHVLGTVVPEYTGRNDGGAVEARGTGKPDRRMRRESADR